MIYTVECETCCGRGHVDQKSLTVAKDRLDENRALCPRCEGAGALHVNENNQVSRWRRLISPRSASASWTNWSVA